MRLFFCSLLNNLLLLLYYNYYKWFILLHFLSSYYLYIVAITTLHSWGAICPQISSYWYDFFLWVCLRFRSFPHYRV